MWTGEKTKLEIAAELVLKAYTYANRSTQFIVLCDSWYPKGVFCDMNKIPNISIICNVRVDTAAYSLPEKSEDDVPRRGRPRLIGEKIDVATVPVVEVKEGTSMLAMCGSKQSSSASRLLFWQSKPTPKKANRVGYSCAQIKTSARASMHPASLAIWP